MTILNKVSSKTLMPGITPIPDVPDAPTIGSATAATATTATVTYTAAVTGGTVTTFTATSTPGSLTGTGSSPITVLGLTSGTAYTFKVKGTNATATGPESAASNSITPQVTLAVTTSTSMPAARAFGTAPSNAYHNGRYWFIGGASVSNPDTNATNSVYSFNGTSWTTETNYSASYNASSAVSDGTNLYVIGGSPVSNGSDAVKYISGTGGSWSTGPSLPAPAHRQACVYYSGKIHALNGDDNTGSTTTRHYRLDSGSWTTLSSTGNNAYYPSAAVFNSRIYKYGYNTLSYYDGTSWTNSTTPPVGVYAAHVLATSSKLYAIGGNTTAQYTSGNVSTIYSYNGTSWTTESVTLPVQKGYGGCGTDGTDAYIYGGNSNSSITSTNYKLTLP